MNGEKEIFIVTNMFSLALGLVQDLEKREGLYEHEMTRLKVKENQTLSSASESVFTVILDMYSK